MKKIAMFITAAFAAASLYADLNILVVDTNQVLASYYKTKIAADALKASVEPVEAEIKKLDGERQSKIAAFEEGRKKLQNPALTDDAKKDIIAKELQPVEKQINELGAQLQQLVNETRANVAKQQRETLSAHSQEALAQIKKIAEAKKADFVFEKNGCYFAKPASDITEEVVAALNANAPKSAAPKADAAKK